MLSSGKLYSTLGHWGVGVFANKTLRTNDVVMEVMANQTVSSFDDVFPYMNIARGIAKRFENYTTDNERAEFLLLLNINYIRFFGFSQTNRFWKFYFETLPNYYDYLPFWKEEEKQIMAKFTFNQELRESMFKHPGEALDYMIETLVKQIRKIDPSYIQLALNDNAIKDTVNLIKIRLKFIFSMMLLIL